MSRKDDLLALCEGKKESYQLVEEILFLEKKLEEIKELPFIKKHPSDPEKQKILPALRAYKELLQQYSNCLKTLEKIVGKDDNGGTSPLREWIEEKMGMKKC